ncbi:unnamed protein product [Scytosiphon promiscuus]
MGLAVSPEVAFVGAPSLHSQVLRVSTPTALKPFSRTRLWPSGWAGEGEEPAFDSNLQNRRLPVPNEYLAGWALTQNDTACLRRFQDMGYTEPSGDTPGGDREQSGLRLWGEATRALMDRVDIVRDLDQRRLAASRYWQRLQSRNPPSASSTSPQAKPGKSDAFDAKTPSWGDVNSLFENDDGFVRRESERYIEEAAEFISDEGGWSSDRVSREWVASYRLSMFETRRQAQRFFSWGIPDEGALDCILEPGKRVLEVGSGLGYWAHLLKLRSGDDSRVRCFDPYAPARRRDSATDGASSPSPSELDEGSDHEEEEADEWFGEGRAPFTPVERGSFERIAHGPGSESNPEDSQSEKKGIDSSNDCDKFRAWSLFICWPSDGQWPAACLTEFEGDDFFYVGEAEGGATRMPWRLLKEEWELEQRVAIPTWPGFKDALWWYRRKGAAALPTKPNGDR